MLKRVLLAAWLAAPIFALATAHSAARRGSALFPAEGPRIPLGLVPIVWPPENPYTPDKAELGWLLYYDKRLSADGTLACASCHNPKFAFTDGAPVSTGIRGQKGGRSAPTVINRAYSVEQFWDGRAPTLEEQAKGPMANPIEMGNTHDRVVSTLREVAGYRQRFRQIFGSEEFTIDHVARAIATFERCVLSGNSPYDRYRRGDRTALSESQLRGLELFRSTRTKCESCHESINLTNGMFTNVGIGMDRPMPDLGRFEFTKRESDKGAFKTPSLREVARTGPYMHDGSLATLEQVVEHYSKGGIKNPWLHQNIKPMNFTAQEKVDLVAFLHTLSGEGWQHYIEPSASLMPK